MTRSLITTLQYRRQALSTRFEYPVLLWSGCHTARNFPANIYPFRASSHFLYFAGKPLTNAVLAIAPDKTALYWDEALEGDALWHGPTPTGQEIAMELGVDYHFSLNELSQWQDKVFGTLPVQDERSRHHQQTLRQDSLTQVHWTQMDAALAEAVVDLRRIHDDGAIAEIRAAVDVTVQGHLAGVRKTIEAQRESEVRAAIEAVFIAQNMSPAYNSIVTVHGEVLHNQQYHHSLDPNDLLLVDAGAETEQGWASDVTRTWPVSGQFSGTQRDMYQGVLATHDACIEAIAPGVEYRDIHLLAVRKIAEMLVDLGILKGQVETLMEHNVPAYFFPHGVGHLLGLDVHDMEDLGDRAGYAPGRTRSDRFGLQFLRLDRPLQDRMIVTIEPGFYQIPQLLKQAKTLPEVNDAINWTRLEKFTDVRGIRIEDDVLITQKGAEVLTQALPTTSSDIEALMH